MKTLMSIFCVAGMLCSSAFAGTAIPEASVLQNAQVIAEHLHEQHPSLSAASFMPEVLMALEQPKSGLQCVPDCDGQPGTPESNHGIEYCLPCAHTADSSSQQ